MSISVLTTAKAEEILNFLGYDIVIQNQQPYTGGLSDFQKKLQEYQREHFIPVTGILDVPTERSLLQVRFCQLPEAFSLNIGQSKWPFNKISWAISNQFKLPGFSLDDISDVFKWCFQQWANVANLTFLQVKSNDAPHILITSGRIDSAGNTLAWSELPNGSPDIQLTQKFDHHEPFIFSENPPPNKIDLGAVGVHEIGHALGIEHLPANSRNLMAPIYNPKIRIPQQGDIQAIIQRYGSPIPPSVPLPPVGPQPPLNPYIPIPYDPANPSKKIFPAPLACPPLAGYTWVALPNAFFPNPQSQ